MPVKLSKFQRKEKYDERLCKLLDDYGQVLIAVADNVGSNQLQDIRKGLRGDSVFLMGKNTLIRRCIRVYAEKTSNREYLNLLPLLVGNVGLIFTKGGLKVVSEEVAKYKVGAPVRVGLVAPVDVVNPPGNTGLDPSQTSFFQMLNIPTKINKGTVEIITPVEKEFLDDPTKFAVAAAVPVVAPAAATVAEKVEEEKKEEEPEEEGDDEDLGMGLFDDE